MGSARAGAGVAMPGWVWWLLVAVLVVVVVYLSNTAGRLDRLHRRVEVSRYNLARALERRRDLAELTAGVGLLDPASALLIDDAVARVDRAEEADALESVEVGLAESDLSAVLAAVFADREEVALVAGQPGADAVGRLADSCRRVQIGRRFYNDAVNATRSMRQRRVVRLFRLQGTAPMPRSFEMNDQLPAGFAGM